MSLSIKDIKVISKIHGDAFYILDSEQFVKNWNELTNAFRAVYPETYIAYSYKTNYIPRLCKLVDSLGGYAEIVSSMEYQIAKKIGVDPTKIIFNGPYKDPSAVEEILTSGGTINVDSVYELPLIMQLALKYPHICLNVGIRCNFDVNDGVISRFGIDIDSNDFIEVVGELSKVSNIKISGIHCHFASRSLETWMPRAKKMIEIYDENFDGRIDNIDLGGGLFGKMKDSLKSQFDSYIPNYIEYANEAATLISARFSKMKNKPKLFIEPGSALVGDVMNFVSKVMTIKTIREQNIATLLGSIYNINPTLNKKNPPIIVLHDNDADNTYYENVDFGGFTCIESDYLYRGYSGRLNVNDFIIFENVGSYSVVLKPPFILPNFPILEFDLSTQEIDIIKRQETFEDLFVTYKF